jgi:hypothetical protein
MDGRALALEDTRRLLGSIPDSRPKVQRGQILTPLGWATPVFCVSCGAPGGFAFVDTTFILYLCPDCEKFGGGLDLPVVDEDYVRGRKGDGSCSTTT